MTHVNVPAQITNYGAFCNNAFFKKTETIFRNDKITSIFKQYLLPIGLLEAIYNYSLFNVRHLYYRSDFASNIASYFMQSSALNFISDNITKVANQIYNHAFKRIGTNLTPFICIIGPITEELLFRTLLQEEILKRLPKKILGNNYGSMIDTSLAVRTARVFFTALVFANFHHSAKSYIWNDCFVFGLLLGGLQDVTGSTLPSIFAHIVHNTLESYKIVPPLGNY